MNATDLAGASNAAVYASMSTLSVAMIAFAISFASGRRRTQQAQTQLPVFASIGSTAVLTRPEPKVPAEAEAGRIFANVGMSLTWLGFVLLFVGVVLRGVWAGRVPWGNMYEFSITSALGILGAF